MLRTTRLHSLASVARVQLATKLAPVAPISAVPSVFVQAMTSVASPLHVKSVVSIYPSYPVAANASVSRAFAKKAEKGKEKEKENNAPRNTEVNANHGFEEKMKSHLEHLKTELANIRIGRPAPEQLHDVVVDLEGVYTPLKALGQVYARPPQSLLVALHDPSHEAAVIRAISNCGLELNPVVEVQAGKGSSVIVVPFPKPTRELRENMIKMAKTKSEDTKLQVRQVRKLWMDELKAAAGSKDDTKRLEKACQTVTDKFIDEVTALVAAKEKEISTA